jgi:hypothetical protein
VGSFKEVIPFLSRKGKIYIIFRGEEGESMDLGSLGSVSVQYRGKKYSLYKIYVE